MSRVAGDWLHHGWLYIILYERHLLLLLLLSIQEQQEGGLDVTEIAAVADTPTPRVPPNERLGEGGGRGERDEATGGGKQTSVCFLFDLNGYHDFVFQTSISHSLVPDEGAVGGQLDVATGGIADANTIQIDEQLFAEELDQEDVEVDESLFDVENLEELNIDDIDDADTMD